MAACSKAARDAPNISAVGSIPYRPCQITIMTIVLDPDKIPQVYRDNPEAIQSLLDRLEHGITNLPPYIDQRGHLRIKSLFLETSKISDTWTPYFTPIWTLRDRRVKLSPSHHLVSRYPDGWVPSFREAYMAISDPTEYLVGTQLLGDYTHWLRLARCKWLKPYLERWRAELATKLESEAIQAVRATMALQEGSSALQAARYLADKISPPKRGRPSKEEIEGQLKKDAQAALEHNEDAQRLGLTK